MSEWSTDPVRNHHFLASARAVSSISPFYSERGSRRKGLLGLLEGRKKINKNVNLVEKSCPRLAVGRDKMPYMLPTCHLALRQSPKILSHGFGSSSKSGNLEIRLVFPV